MRPRICLAACILLVACTRRQAPAPATDAGPATFRPADLPRIDLHAHLGGVRSHRRALELGDRYGIDTFVNLSGEPPGRKCRGKDGPIDCLSAQVVLARSTGRVVVFTQPPWEEVRGGPGYGERMAAALELAKQRGAVGLKIAKVLGLGLPTPDGKRALPVDDPSLDPLWRKAGELGMPVAIHTGDPKAFWQPVTPANERWDELSAHPGWAYADAEGKTAEGLPTWEALYSGFERLVLRHPKTVFIGVHFGNDPEDPKRVARLLERAPNFYIDTAARVPEIGRHDAAEMRKFYERWQDRILFGTDLGVGDAPEDLMLGSTDGKEPGPADVERFFVQTFRYFETRERAFEHPTPIQGRWRIDGVGLPRDVLEKVYYRNAMRLLGLPAPARARTIADAGTR